jgi:hypothetical protein
MHSQTPPSAETARKDLPHILQLSLRDLELKRVLIFLAIGAIAIKLFFVAFEIGRYHRALPAALVTAGLVTSGNDTRWIEYFLPVRHEPCGGFIFHLSSATLKAIETRGLAFFADATQGRGVTEANSRAAMEFSYQPWQPTPLPPGYFSNGMWPGLHCMGWKISPLGRQVLAAAQGPGAYFTTAPSKLLLVIPSQGLVVLTYNY